LVCGNFVARLVRNLLPTGFLYGSPKPVFAQTVPKDFQGGISGGIISGSEKYNAGKVFVNDDVRST